MAQPDLIRDTICVSEMILDSSVEQSVELDYFLPDYFPNIFKLLKTSILPSIQSTKASGNKLTLDGIACVRILYLAETTNRVCCVEQKVPFSKTIDLPSECRNPMIHVLPRCYFVNGRAVNQRRLDIRGGISCKVRVMEQREESVVVGGTGGGLQCHQLAQPACCARKIASKPFVVTEDLELGSSKPAFGTFLHSSCVVIPTDCKLITNKVICKGDLVLHLLYVSEEENAKPECMDFSIPISQIVDLPGVDEDYTCDLRFSVVGVSIDPRPDESGQNRILNCEFTANLICTADKNREYQLVDDVYSTQHETTLVSHPAYMERLITASNLTLVTKNTIDTGANPIAGVSDVFMTFGDISVKQENGELFVSGNMEASVFCIGTDSMPFMLEKTIPCELKVLSDLGVPEVAFLPNVEILSTGFTILSESGLELRAEMRISGMIYERRRFQAISDIAVNEDAQKPRDALCALRICYADEGDSVWDIAKSYSTSMGAVMVENGLEQEILPVRTMLLIPLIDG